MYRCIMFICMHLLFLCVWLTSLLSDSCRFLCLRNNQHIPISCPSVLSVYTYYPDLELAASLRDFTEEYLVISSRCECFISELRALFEGKQVYLNFQVDSALLIYLHVYRQLYPTLPGEGKLGEETCQ